MTPVALWQPWKSIPRDYVLVLGGHSVTRRSLVTEMSFPVFEAASWRPSGRSDKSHVRLRYHVRVNSDRLLDKKDVTSTDG